MSQLSYAISYVTASENDESLHLGNKYWFKDSQHRRSSGELLRDRHIYVPKQTSCRTNSYVPSVS